MVMKLAHKEKQKGLERAWGEMLVKHGFIIKEDETGKDIRKLYAQDSKGLFKAKEGKVDPDHALMEYAEDAMISSPYQDSGTEYVPTGYPASLKRYHIIYETMNLSIESMYFWIIDHIRYDQGYTRAYKIRDIFTATENSAFFGMSQQRLGIQQDRVQTYLATIGKMTKDLFQLVRELRIIDEKMLPRSQWKESKAADVTLKGEFIDLVENRGGQTAPGSVYGLAQNLGYATLPDLFFNLHVYDQDKVEAEVDKLNFNVNLKNLLKRKLYQYINWKIKTDHELETRRTFTLKYLRQHWDVIEMYMNWVKPYLRHIARLQMNDEKLDSIDLIAAFEQAFVETEVLFAKPDTKGGKLLECILLTINFRTRPNMSFVQDGGNRGPVHVGQAEIWFRLYTWNEDHILNYIKYREQEDLYMLGIVDRSIRAAMDALGEELEKYLAEAGEPKYKDKIDEEKKAAEKKKLEEMKRHGLFSGMGEPFAALGGGFGEMIGGGFGSIFSFEKKKKAPSFSFPPSLGTGGSVKGNIGKQSYQIVKNFKKAYGMLSWG